ncbi:MAG: sigma-70 family RNA polymerase sigma factor [Pseudomonas sp.]|uniref:sigma-70 family RNA polymerase sigma factor n=1 Tax=Pseudomonas abieticivorans TaxID=2931382 RepID=UPI0020BF9E4D|nr:sigma-70 family RNA polymerase sigma factor [Pseudomonas sp. PIA16]MDE1167601.1 sigma-70 family RNA polymerase sigma factor [Pseudomonas sp.]
MSFTAAHRQHTLDRLFGEHHHWLFDRLRLRLGCPDDAADMASETFVQVVAMPAPQAIREPRALLTTIAKRLMYDTWRRRDLERAYLEALAAQPEPLEPSPEERALVMESLMAIDALLDGLSSRARTAFLCSQLEGMKYADIAAQLGVSTIRVRQYVAKGLMLCCRELMAP